MRELSEFSLGDFRIRNLLRRSGFVLHSNLLGELLQIWGIGSGYHIRIAIYYTQRLWEGETLQIDFCDEMRKLELLCMHLGQFKSLRYLVFQIRSG